MFFLMRHDTIKHLERKNGDDHYNFFKLCKQDVDRFTELDIKKQTYFSRRN